MIMDKNEYPLDAIHGLYNVKARKKTFENILKQIQMMNFKIGG